MIRTFNCPDTERLFGGQYSRRLPADLHRTDMPKRDFPPIHPGEILLEDFLKPLALSQYRLAKDISVPQRRISEIVQGKRAISADTALRLGRYFDMEPAFWMNLQARHDLKQVEATLGPRLKAEVRRRAA